MRDKMKMPRINAYKIIWDNGEFFVWAFSIKGAVDKFKRSFKENEIIPMKYEVYQMVYKKE
jgi:hypothetical protein